MAISVRMNPELEQQLTLAAKRLGITKSQFITDAVARALGQKDPLAMLQRLQAEEAQAGYALAAAFKHEQQPYDTDASRQALTQKLKAKHSGRRAG